VALLSDEISHLAISRNWKLAYARRAYHSTIRRVEMRRNREHGEISTSPFLSSTRGEEKPQYSPDGKRIAFVSSRSGTPELWVSGADGSNLMQLTSLGGPLFGYLSWSPDGEQIVFHARPYGQADIFVVRVAGGTPKRLTNHPADDLVPTFSRDGRFIYFCSNRTGEYQVWRMPVAGGQPVQITKRGGDITMESEDGSFLYYSKFEGGLWRMPVNGGEEQCIVRSLASSWAFTIGGNTLFYASGPPNNPHPRLYALSLTSGRSRPILGLDRWVGMGMSVTPDLRYLLYTELSQLGSDLMLVENFR
jgi:Tol biopolymer transport system component